MFAHPVRSPPPSRTDLVPRSPSWLRWARRLALAGALAIAAGRSQSAVATPSATLTSTWSAATARATSPHPTATAGPLILVRPAILVEGERVDASVLVPETAPADLRQALARLTLGQIPQPLGQLSLDRRDLERCLGPLAASLALPNRVQIRRRGDLLSGQDVLDRIHQICRQGLADSEAAELAIDASRLPRSFVLPGPLQSFELEPMSSNRLGLRLFIITAQCDGGVFRQIVQVDVARQIKGARLKRLARRGETLTAGDLEEVTVTQRTDSGTPLLRFAEAVGRCLTTYKSPGTLLRAGDVSLQAFETANAPSLPSSHPAAAAPRSGRTPAAAWVIKPGDQVEFFVQSGGLSLKVPAKALEGGAIGASIRLLNLQNHRQIIGTVTGEGKVEYGLN
jgi:flagella basal body P-ring formation protein FlgA